MHYRPAIATTFLLAALSGCDVKTPYGRRIEPPTQKTKDTPPQFVSADAAERLSVLKPVLSFSEFAMPESSERDIVASALSRIGKPAVPELIRVLQHRDPLVRLEAAEVLARIGPDAIEAVPYLTTALDDADERVRKASARALGRVGPGAAPAVPALMRSLVEPSPSIPSPK